jgi:hypothetical protein
MYGVKLRISTAPDAPEAILSRSDIIRFIKKGWIKCEELSIAAVEDKSKANAFNKAVASIQIFWFFSQFLGRLISIIPVSPLECFTLAYVVCALFMYGLWWDKPFDVQTPLSIYSDPLLAAEQKLELKYSLSQCFTKTSKPYSFFDMVGTIGERNDREWSERVSDERITQIVLVISTVLFGSCHLLGWNYPFPTTSETSLWRSASISCVCIPLAIIVVFRSNHGIAEPWALICGCILEVLLILYVVVRLFLFFEVFYALRSAPPEIYKAVPWAQYLPHI